MYKTIAPFSQQGLEKLNDEITKYYFRSVNNHDKDSLQQIQLKLNRLEKLEDSGYAHQKLQQYMVRFCFTLCMNHVY